MARNDKGVSVTSHRQRLLPSLRYNQRFANDLRLKTNDGFGGFMRDVISTKDGPQAIGPYSQAIKANGFVFVSGQIPLDPVTNTLVSGDIAFQTERVLKNLSGILQAAGTGLEKVVRTTVFLKSMGDFAAMNEVYGRYFHTQPPARSTVEVARLPKDVSVEIDVIALA
jgi:2-iminobutanoate/2-iminopropanoate deaminase